MFEEEKQIAELNFKFKNKENYMSYVRNLSTYLHLLFPEQMHKVLYSQHVTTKYDPEGIAFVLEQMRPENCNVYLISKSMEAEATQTEKWYGTKFTKSRFDSDLLNLMEKPGEEDALGLPPKNVFIPDKLEVKEPASCKVPAVVQVDEGGESWLLKDHQFKMPKAAVGLKMYMKGLAEASIEGAVFVSLWSRMLEEQMREFNYMA